jgi:hypothetical protein
MSVSQSGIVMIETVWMVVCMMRNWYIVMDSRDGVLVAYFWRL